MQLKDLEEQLSKTEDRQRKARANWQHHSRILSQKGISLKDFQMNKIQFEYYQREEEEARMDVEALKVQIEKAKQEHEDKEYLVKLAKFDTAMVAKIKALVSQLEVFRDTLEVGRLTSLATELESTYLRLSTGVKLEHRSDFDPQPKGPGLSFFQSLNVRIGHMIEETGEYQKLISVSGNPAIGAQKKANIETWSTQLIGQLSDIAKRLEAKSTPSFLGRVKAVLIGD